MTDIPFISQLARSLPRHATLLERLVKGVEADEQWRWLLISCSVPNGRGDQWSDLDMGLGADCESDDDTPIEAAKRLVASCGALTDLLVHRMPDGRQRLAVEFASEVQFDLVVIPAASARGATSETVVLVDRDRILKPWEPDIEGPPSPETAREWAYLAWWALSDTAKYLARGSVFEAIEQLNRARSLMLQLHAAALGVKYPPFGLVSLLDYNGPLPARLDETYTPPDREAVHRAALLLADLLANAIDRAGAALGTDLHVALSGPVRRRLFWLSIG